MFKPNLDDLLEQYLFERISSGRTRRTMTPNVDELADLVASKVASRLGGSRGSLSSATDTDAVASAVAVRLRARGVVASSGAARVASAAARLAWPDIEAIASAIAQRMGQTASPTSTGTSFRPQTASPAAVNLVSSVADRLDSADVEAIASAVVRLMGTGGAALPIPLAGRVSSPLESGQDPSAVSPETGKE